MNLIQANAFNIPMKDKSVHCAVMSPPYYSLRKYSGEQEFIFGGVKDCKHEFQAHERYHGAPVGKSKTKWQHAAGGSPKTHPEQYEVGQAGTKRVSISAFCHKCNAWRGAYGLEPTLQMYIDHTVEWCREVWRVLRDDGTFWLNLGDSYAGIGGAGGDYNEGGLKAGQPRYPGTSKTMKPSYRRDKEPVPRQMGHAAGLKPKDLMGVPWRVALALQADGWYLRSDIIWHKPNPMPESITDRPTKSHEYLFLLTKSRKYYYDADAIREPNTLASKQRAMRGNSSDNKYAAGEHMPPGVHANTMSQPREFKGYDDMEDAIARGETPLNSAGRNKRTVWTIATSPYSGAHFATYPPALVEPCIKAGTSEHGVCPECGDPWERVVEKIETGETQKMADGWDAEEGSHSTIHRNGRSKGEAGIPVTKNITTGWRPTCSGYDHLYRSEFPQARNARKRHQQYVAGYWWKRVRQRPGKTHWQVIPATILDPFSGSATTIMVARKLGRRGIGLDVSVEYIELAKERLGLKALEEWENGKPGETDYEGLPMFEEAESG